jgi:hypothetical protein
MGASLDRVLALAGADLDAEPQVILAPYETQLALGAQMLGDAFLKLADSDNDGDDDDSEEGDTDHDSHATYKAMMKRGMGKAAAAKICARSDAKKKVAASMIGEALTIMGLVELSVTQAERDKAKAAGNSVGDSYPINNAKQLHAAAVLAASHHGDWKAAQTLIRRRAKELGVSLESLPGFGPASGDSEKMAASMLALAGPALEPPLGMDHSGVMNHGAFTGSHRHGHVVAAAHDHPHFHNGDNRHGHHPGLPEHWH